MTFDFVEALRAALCSPVVRVCLGAMVREEAGLAVREELERRERDHLLDFAATAKYLGKPSVGALEQFLKRPKGAELASLQLRVGGRRCFKRTDLDAWLAQQRLGPMRLVKALGAMGAK